MQSSTRQARIGKQATPTVYAQPYRRNKTVKAPRKRTQLLVLSKRSSAEAMALLCCSGGNNGPNGPGNNGPGGPFIRCCGNGGNDDCGGHSSPLFVASPQAALLLVGAASTAWALSAEAAVAEGITLHSYDTTTAMANTISMFIDEGNESSFSMGDYYSSATAGC